LAQRLADTITWLRDWLSKASAPKLRFLELKSEGNLLSGILLQEGEYLFEGRVEIGFYHDDNQLGTEWVSFKDKVNSLEVRLLNGVNRIRLDPRFRIPRRYNPETPEFYKL